MHRMKLNATAGFTIIETLAGVVIVIITVLAAGVIFSDYWAMSEKLKKEAQSNDLSVVLVSDIFQSPMSEIITLCNQKSAWTLKTSGCKSLDLRNIPSTKVSVTTSTTDVIPAYSSLLGKNLGAFATSGSVNPSCVDLIRCEKVISSSFLELTFSYTYLSPKKNEVLEKTMILRRGPW